MDGQETRLVDHFVEPEQFPLVKIRPFDDLDHLGDHGARQIAGLGQLQPACLDCSSQEDQGSAGHP